MMSSDEEDGVPCKTPSPRSSASQAPPNPRHNIDEPPPRVNLHTTLPATSHSANPFKGFSRKLMSKPRGRGIDIGAPLGVYDTPNVRERVRRWQQSGGGVVLPGDVIELPPISPATPTPGTRRGGHNPPHLMPAIDMTLSGIASTMSHDLKSEPLAPPRMPAVRDDWGSASEEEKELDRQRTRSKDRERKMRRRTGSDAGTERGAASGPEAPTRAQTNSPASRAVYEEDGIRIAPIRPKQRSSGSRRRKKEKPAYETDDGGVRLTLEREPPPPRAPDLKPIRIERSTTPDTATEVRTPRSDWFPENPRDSDDGIRVKPIKSVSKKRSKTKSAQTTSGGFEIEIEFPRAEPARPTKPMDSGRVRVSAWDDTDGIRIYTSSPIKSTDRKRSVRHSAKTVRSRREQYEASNREGGDSHMVSLTETHQGEEGDDEGDAGSIATVTMTKGSTRDGSTRDIEGSTVVEEGEPAQKRWEPLDDNFRSATADSAATTKYEDYDDGIRIRPIKKSRSTRRKRSPEGSTRPRDLLSSGIDDSFASETVMEPQSTLSESTFAPSNGTGRRNTVPSSPYTVRERANSYQSGEPDVALKRKKSKRVERVPSQKKSLERVASKMRSEGPVRDTSPFSEMSERRPRTKYSPSRDRDERRAERREMRRQLREDSEKFQDMATRARSASPATRRPITPPPTTREYPTLRDLIAAEARKESEEQERRYNESEAQERRYSESLPPVEIPLVRERPAVREKTVVSEPPISKIIPLVRGDSVVKERRRTREVHTSKAIPLVREDSVARDKPRARDSPVHRSIPLVREDSVREKPRARASPVSRTIPLVREDSVRDKPRGREPPSSKPIQLVRDDSVRDKPRGREAPVAKSTPMARERTVVRERLGLRDENSSKPIPLVREDSIAKEMPASKAIPLVRERSVARDKPAVQDRSVVRDKSAVRERPLARDSPVPPQAPDIRSGRARRKSISGAVSSSVDDLRLKWERPGLSSPRPSFFSSSDSLPLDKGKPSRASKTTPALARTRSRSTPPAPRPSRVEHTSGRKLHHPEFPSAPAQKKEAVLVPKLSSLLKAVKEEFKGKSVRTATMLMDDNSESSLTETNSETETDDSEDESEEEVAVVKKKKKTVRIQEAVEDITTDTSESVSTTSESSSDSSSYSESGSDGVVGQVEVEGTSDSESGSDSGSESDSTAEIHEELVALVEQVPAKPLVQNDVQPLDWPAPEPPKSPVAETLKTPAVEPLKTTPTKPLEEPAVKILSETLAPAASKTPPVEEPAMETTKPAVTSPVVEEPVVEEPVVEKPVVEVPIAEAPVVEEPIVEEPAVEEPVVQAAKILVVEVTKSPAVETVETVVERPTKTSIEQAPDVQPLKPSSSIRQLSKASIFANKLPSVEANPPKAASSTTSASAPAIPGRPVKPSKAKRRAERLAEALLTKESVEPAVGSPVAKQPTEPVPESPVSNKSAVESPTDDEPVKLLVETQTPAGTVNQPVGIPTSNETVENIVETLKEPVEDIKKPEPEPVETPNAITKPEEPVEKAAEIPNIEIPVDVLQPIKKPKGTAKPRAKTLVEKALEALQAGSSAKQTLEVSEVDNQSVEPPKVDDLAPKSKEVSTIEELVAKPPQTPPSEVPDAKPLDTAAVKKVNRPITMSGFMTSTFKESIIQKPAEESLKSTMQPIFKISDEKTPKTPTTLTSEDPIEQRVVSPHQKAMGTVEEPPKRSVRDLVKQLEKPSGKKTKTGLSEEILKDLLREGEKSKERSIDETEINSVEAAVADMVNESSGSIQKAVNGSSETVKEPAEITVEPLKLSCKKVIVEVTEPIKPLSPKKATAEPVKPISLKNDVKAETKSSTMQNIPELSIPRRTLRSTTSPPRPRSTVSDGSLTPTGSVFDDGFDDDDSPVRNLSDASTIKPLRFTKISKPQVIELVKPSRSKIKAEKGPEADEIEDWFNPDSLEKVSSLKRKYTKHTDLISILSVPNSSSVRSAHRSRRSKGRKRVEILTIEDILGEFATEEVKYLRELRTLVEDVVPILFQTVLGRADDDLRRTSSVSSIGTCSSRSSRTGFSSNPTRPIVDMGISLERLRTLHDRIPTDNVDRIIAWAGDARRVYEEYLTVWRMGFQEVVVTMTPLPGEEEYDQASRDANIRKDLELLHGTKGGVGTAFEGDPSTWAMPPPPSIEEDPKDEKVDVAFLLKRPLVRLKLLAKLFKRIDYMQPSPMAASLSTSFHALVLMARRKISEEKARIEDDAATSLDVSKVYDMHMLLPRRDIISLDQYRRVKARDSFQMRLYHSSDDLIERNIELILREPSSRTKFSEGEILFVEVGEDSSKSLLFPPIPLSAISSRTGDAAGEIVVMVRGVDHELTEWREIMALASSTAAGFEWVQMLGLVPIPPEGPFSKEPIEPAVLETVIEESIAPSRHYSPAQPRRGKSRRTPKAQPEATNDNVPVEPDTNTASEPAEEKIKQIPIAMSHGWLPLDFSAGLLEVPTGYQGNFGGNFEVPKVNFKVQKPDNDARDITRSPSLHTLSESDIGQSPSAAPSIKRSHRASRRHSRSSSITSEESLHSGKQLTRAASVHLDDQERESVEANLKKHAMDNIPDLSPSKAKKTEGSSPPPPVPPHRTPTNASNRSGPPPTSAGNKSRFGGRRRTSSPLKHEYDPSLSNSDSERLEGEKLIQEDEDHDYTSSSEPSSSEDEDSDDAVSLCSEEEDGDYPPPLLSIPRGVSRQTSRTMMQSTSMDSLGISDNSSELTQRPTAPSQPDQPPPPVPQIGARFKCYIFVWATNQWDKLSTGECRLLITPGRIEAYPIVQTSPNGTAEAAIDFSLNQSEQIFAFDLNTKLAIRRGTAVDISIRSPPNSKLAGASIMLRLKSPNECEALHGAINTYRIYPQDLQLPLTTTVSSLNLSSEISDSSTAVAGNIKRGFGAWAKSKTYRAGSTPSLVSSPSETSINSISSAFSRLRANKIFKNSPLSSATSSTSSMENSRNGSPMGLPNVPGIENSIVSMSPMKVRLYRRENASKWRDLGNARLNVLKPNEGQRGKSINEDDKRVVITNKKGDAILLDVVLGESAFERVARTGIAISILTGEGEEDGTLKPADIGGIGAKNTVYMMQMTGEAEAAYSFSILGKLRY